MQFFLDSTDIKEIRELAQTGLIDGVTTNPTLVAQANRPFADLIKEICDNVEGSVSAEVIATDSSEMVKQGRELGGIAPNVTVKIPLTYEGLRACKVLSDEGISVNVTLCFSANQALLAAKAGANYISPFIGRLDDISQDGMDLIHDIRNIYNNYPYETLILGASIRNPLHVLTCARAGVDVVTVPPKIFRQLYQHPLTERGLEQFLSDWQKSGLTLS